MFIHLFSVYFLHHSGIPVQHAWLEREPSRGVCTCVARVWMEKQRSGAVKWAVMWSLQLFTGPNSHPQPRSLMRERGRRPERQDPISCLSVSADLFVLLPLSLCLPSLSYQSKIRLITVQACLARSQSASVPELQVLPITQRLFSPCADKNEMKVWVEAVCSLNSI